MTRQEIEALQPGDVLERTLDTIAFSLPTKVKPNARWGMRGEITEISYRGTSVHGRVYVGGYTKFGSGAMSFSVSEGEEDIRLVLVEVAK